MTTYTIRPSALIAKDNTIQVSSNSGSSWATGTNAQIAGYAGDALDSTGLRSSGSGSRWFQLTLGAPVIPSDEFVAKVSGWVRWSGGASGKYIGCLPYKTSGSVPGGVPALATDGRGSATTTELGYTYSGWENSVAAGLGLTVFMDGHATATSRPIVWDTGAYVYTLQRATASPQATTISGTTYPTIPVDVTAVIGWEADSYTWENWRKITVEVRVESGGTSVGAGTLMSTTSQDYYFDESGTVTYSIAMPDSLANGSYKVYARAIRHRYNETAIADDQVGSWSTGQTLTMSVTPPTKPTITASANNTLGRVEIAVTPVATGGYSSPFITVERSADNGDTWAQVRALSAIAGAFGVPYTCYDYEAPRGQVVMYRARVSAYTAGVLNASVNSLTAQTQLGADTWNLKCPQAPNLNMIGVTVVGNPDEEIGEDLGVFRPFGRRYPVTVAGTMTGWDGSLELVTQTAAEWAQVKALIEAQAVLYLESPFGWAKYIRLTSGAKTTMHGTATAPRRRVACAYVETAAPAGGYSVSGTSQFGSTTDGGTASTSSWDATYDGGTASTSSFADSADGGAAA